MLKRIATLLSLTLLLIVSVGIWLLFPLLQGYYRVKAHHAIEYQRSELVTLRLKSSEFKRVGNNEIVYKNLRYDIEKEQNINDLYVFRAYPDYLETQLLAFFDETWQSVTDASETHSPVSQLIQKILSADHFCTWVLFDFDPVFTQNTSPSFSYILPDFWAYSASLSPPPEV